MMDAVNRVSRILADLTQEKLQEHLQEPNLTDEEIAHIKAMMEEYSLKADQSEAAYLKYMGRLN